MASKEKELPSGDKSHPENVKIAVESILKGKTKVTKRKKTPEDLHRDRFIYAISQMEYVDTREYMLSEEFDLDLSKYNEPFYNTIDSLLSMMFNEHQITFINFYLNDRIDEEGRIIPLVTQEGMQIYLNNPSDLYDFLKNIK